MKLLANENIPLLSSEYLDQQGYDIKHIGIVNPSISDEDVMNLAILENRVILTFDSDYGNLVFRDGYRPLGVIFLRIQNYLPRYPGEFLHALIQSQAYNFEGKFTVANERSIRQRKIS